MLISAPCGGEGCPPCDDCPPCSSSFYDFDTLPPDLTYVRPDLRPGQPATHNNFYVEGGFLKLETFCVEGDSLALPVKYAAKNVNLCNGYLRIRAEVYRKTDFNQCDISAGSNGAPVSGIAVGDPTWADDGGVLFSTPPNNRIAVEIRHDSGDCLGCADLNVDGKIKDDAGNLYTFSLFPYISCPPPGTEEDPDCAAFFDFVTLEIEMIQAIDETWTVNISVDGVVQLTQSSLVFSWNTIATLTGVWSHGRGGKWDALCITTCDDYVCPSGTQDPPNTDCCDVFVPESLPVRRAGLFPGSGTLAYAADSGPSGGPAWTGSVTGSNCTTTVGLICDSDGLGGFRWKLSINGSTYRFITETVECDPFSVVIPLDPWVSGIGGGDSDFVLACTTLIIGEDDGSIEDVTSLTATITLTPFVGDPVIIEQVLTPTSCNVYGAEYDFCGGGTDSIVATFSAGNSVSIVADFPPDPNTVDTTYGCDPVSASGSTPEGTACGDVYSSVAATLAETP